MEKTEENEEACDSHKPGKGAGYSKSEWLECVRPNLTLTQEDTASAVLPNVVDKGGKARHLRIRCSREVTVASLCSK